MAFFLISSMVLGLLDQLLIFSQLYLIELLGLLTGLGLLELWHLIYPRLLIGFGILVFFTNLSLVEFQVRYLALLMFFRAGSTGSTSFFLWEVYSHYSDGLHDFSATICRCYKDAYVNRFFPCTVRLWNSLPVECFPLTYDLSGFKLRINRHLLTVGSL